MNKIISKTYALQLVKAGKAVIETSLTPDNNDNVYVAVTRYDAQETVHYRA